MRDEHGNKINIPGTGPVEPGDDEQRPVDTDAQPGDDETDEQRTERENREREERVRREQAHPGSADWPDSGVQRS